jgi:ABC-type sugar transport system permease subunit
MWTRRRFPALWLLPALAPVALLTLYPVGHALWTSLHSVTLLFPGTPFVGLENYERVVTSGYFATALRNSMLFALLAAPTVVCFGVLIALFLQRRFAGALVVRSAVLLPWVLPGAISAVLWIWVFHPSFGILNGLLMRLGAIDSLAVVRKRLEALLVRCLSKYQVDGRGAARLQRPDRLHDL